MVEVMVEVMVGVMVEVGMNYCAASTSARIAAAGVSGNGSATHTRASAPTLSVRGATCRRRSVATCLSNGWWGSHDLHP